MMNNKKKLVIFSLKGPATGNLSGGAEVHLKELALSIAESGVDVKIICGKDKDESYLPSVERYHENMIVYRFESPFGFLPFSLIKTHLYYNKYLRKETTDIIEYQSVLPLGTFFYKKLRSLVILHITGKDYVRKQGKIKGSIGYLLEIKLMPFLYKRKQVLTISEYTKKQIESLGFKSKRIKVIPPVVDTMRVDNNLILSRENIISYIGRYTGRSGNKRVDDLIEVMPQVLKEIPDAKLIVGGSMKNGDELKKLVGKLKLDYCVDFKGYITDQDKVNILKETKVFASPSNQEGFGITYVEANALGTPVVGYEIGNLDTVPEYAGIMVEQNNKKELAEAIIYLMKEKRVWEQYSRGALRNAKRFDLQTVKKKIVMYFNEISKGE